MIGIDIISIERFKDVKESDFPSWEKFFTEDEWRYAFDSAHTAERLAGIFAAKEAVMKAVGAAVVKRYDLIEIIHNFEGAPTVHLAIGEKKYIVVSISHDAGLAVAIAQIER